MSGRARHQNSSQDTLVRVVGEKEPFCAMNVSCFPSKDLTCLDLLGLTASASVACVTGRFWLVLLRLRFAGWWTCSCR